MLLIAYFIIYRGDYMITLLRVLLAILYTLIAAIVFVCFPGLQSPVAWCIILFIDAMIIFRKSDF